MNCDTCGKAFKPDDDVVLMGERGNFHQACFLKDKTAARIEALEAALQRIVQWSEAYPLDIFPEPDMGYARALLAHGAITLDSVSASCMRDVVEGVGKIARAALAPE